MASQLFAGLVFGAIGFAAFIYGKKQARMRTMVLGLVLMVYPYLVTNAMLLWGIGAVLTACLWLFRE